MNPCSGSPGKGTRIKMQAGFRREFTHGRSPTPHRHQLNTVRGGVQGEPGNSDIDALPDSDCSQKFSARVSGENFIRSYSRLKISLSRRLLNIAPSAPIRVYGVQSRKPPDALQYRCGWDFPDRSDVGIERIDPGQQALHFADVDDTGKTRFPQPLLEDRGTDRAFVHNDDFRRRLGVPRSLALPLKYS